MAFDFKKEYSEPMANILTSCRILCSIVLLYFPTFSPWFYALYIVSGFTDMIDGTVARKTNTVSEFGTKLDTVADFIFDKVTASYGYTDVALDMACCHCCNQDCKYNLWIHRSEEVCGRTYHHEQDYRISDVYFTINIIFC